MDLTLLKNAGLSAGEITIFQTLLEKGELSVGELIKETAIKRGDCYNKLYELKGKGLVGEFEKDKKKYFRLEHPNKIEDFIDSKLSQYQFVKKEFSGIMPDLISSYNLAYHKPGVQYFEGEDAIKRILDDSLTAKTDILSYADVENFLSSFSILNKEYLKRRYERGINKKFIVGESELNRKYFSSHPELTEIRFINYPLEQFRLNVQIYDNKVSYLSFKNEKVLGIIIEDPFITKLQRQLFDYMWSTAKS